MTIDELNKQLIKANETIEKWRNSNGEIEFLPDAIETTLDNYRETIIEYLKSNNQ